jgi:hypothetical protein
MVEQVCQAIARYSPTWARTESTSPPRELSSHCIRVLFLLLGLLSAERPATANVLSSADYVEFHQLGKRMRPLGLEISTFMMRPPMPWGSPAAAFTQDCMIRLSLAFDSFEDQFNKLGMLVGLAAKMVDGADEHLVLGVVTVEVTLFLSKPRSPPADYK